MKITVRLIDPTSSGSIFLEEIASAVQQNAFGVVDREKQEVSGTKGELITALLISVATGIASSAIYDLIKAAIRKLTDSAKAKGEVAPEVKVEEVDE